MTADDRRGDVRMRSNVVLADTNDSRTRDKAWDLVPGEVVGDYKHRHLEKPLISRKRQRNERDYYFPCVECGRLIHQINLEGCSHPRCLAPPSEAEVAAARGRRDEALAVVRAEEEQGKLAGTDRESDDLPPLLDPEAAVDRLLALQAVAQGTEPQRPPKESDSVRGLAAPAKAALAATASRTGTFSSGYAATPFDNVVDSLTLGQARTAFKRLAEADGKELSHRTKAPPKFHAAHSSAALVVNAFGAWLDSPSWLQVAGRTDFESIEFERKFPTGLAGNPPNLDVFLSSPDCAVAIESKCTEHLSPHVASFPDGYSAVVSEVAHESWQDLFAEVVATPSVYRWLDVGQLIRHYLGLRRALLAGDLRTTALVYLYWEPSNGSAHKTICEHRNEVEDLARRVDDPALHFASQSYPELWETWSRSGNLEWIPGHVEALRARYEVEID